MRKLAFWLGLNLAALFVYQTAEAAGSGDPVPKCQLKTLDGNKSVDFQQMKGQVLYVDFWASWCGPCAKSIPFINQLHHDLKDKGLTIVGVNLDEDPKDAKTFLDQYSADFTVASDTSGECAESFDVKAMPSSFLVGRDGVIRHVQMGFRSDETKALREQAEKLIAEDASAVTLK